MYNLYIYMYIVDVDVFYFQCKRRKECRMVDALHSLGVYCLQMLTKQLHPLTSVVAHQMEQEKLQVFQWPSSSWLKLCSTILYRVKHRGIKVYLTRPIRTYKHLCLSKFLQVWKDQVHYRTQWRRCLRPCCRCCCSTCF